jgi:hypothetical protein
VRLVLIVSVLLVFAALGVGHVVNPPAYPPNNVAAARPRARTIRIRSSIFARRAAEH